MCFARALTLSSEGPSTEALPQAPSVLAAGAPVRQGLCQATGLWTSLQEDEGCPCESLCCPQTPAQPLPREQPLSCLLSSGSLQSVQATEVWEPERSEHLLGFPEPAPSALVLTSSSTGGGVGQFCLVITLCTSWAPGGPVLQQWCPWTAATAWDHIGKPLKSIPLLTHQISTPLEGTAPVVKTLGRGPCQVQGDLREGAGVEPGQLRGQVG